MRNVRSAGDILVHHGRVVDKRQMLQINAEIAPVGLENVLTPLGQLQRVKHLLGRICAGAQHIGVIALKHLGVRVSLGGGYVCNAVQHLLKQRKQLLHLLARAGHLLLHGVNKWPYPGGHGDVHVPAVPVGADCAEAVFTGDPVKLHAVSVQNVSHIAGVIRRTVVTQLMQGRLNLKASPPKAGRRAAGQVVLFNQKRPFSRKLALQGGRHTGVAGAYHHNIIFGHLSFLLNIF